jgi:PleD family two-component response regulator
MLSGNSWIQKSDEQVRVTASVGATMAIPAEPPDALVAGADRSMHASSRLDATA